MIFISKFIMKIINNTKSFFSNGNARTIAMKRNVLYMLLIKGCSIFLGLFTVPLTLGYVNKETYGLWLTISSMIAWMSYFDIGLNNGLKNNLAAAFAKNDYDLGKRLVSTTYALLILIFIPIMIILLLVVQFIDLESILNISSGSVQGLRLTVCISISYFCIQFILSTLNVVLLADQRPADSSFRILCTQFFSIIIIYLLTLTTKGNLVYLCLASTFAPLLILFLFNIVLFSKRYKKISPNVKYVNFSFVPSLMNLGVKFFIIQIAVLVQFQLTNFLIMRYYGPSDVTEYNVAQKFFSILFMVWSITVSPLWVATTDAYVRKDFIWIRNALKKYIRLIFVFIFVGVIMFYISPLFFKLWLHDTVIISKGLSFWLLVYYFVQIFASVFVNVLNGCGVLKTQTITSMISPFVFLIAFFLLKGYGIGFYSVLIASIIANFNGIIIAPIQCLQLFWKKKH